ncbi:dynein axonemal heavy chain 8 isoform X2 [Engystomops pustulosus]|uniref:dynein axonemal heavy chain 8 isoform X2 n=1 Tax=Engystomops pustulosus TaxID=76066 RepID=UPI003AFB1D86
MEQPVNPDTTKDTEPAADVTATHGPDTKQGDISGPVMPGSTTPASSTTQPLPKHYSGSKSLKTRRRVSEKVPESSKTAHISRSDGKSKVTSQSSASLVSIRSMQQQQQQPLKHRRSMHTVQRLHEMLKQNQLKHKEEREYRRAKIDSRYEYIFVILAQRLDLEPTDIEELALDAPSFQDFDDLFSIGGRKSLIFFYQEDEVPGIECGRTFPGTDKGGKMMRLLIGNIDEEFKGLCLFFIRCNNNIAITEKNIHEELHFSVLEATQGLFSGIAELLSRVFVPAINVTDNWGLLNQSRHGERKKQQFREAIDQHLSYLLRVKTTMDGVIRLKNIEFINFSTLQSLEGIRAAASDEVMLSRCEGALMQWCSQIQQVLIQGKLLRREAADAAPVTELEHWIRMYVKFSSIMEQIKGKNFVAIITVLKMAKSKLVQMWKEMSPRIADATIEAKGNVKLLYELEQACQPLYTLDMASMVHGMQKLLSVMHTIYRVSTYYQAPEHITSLFKKVTHQIVTVCKAYITEKGRLSVWDQKTSTAMLKIQECTDLIQEYRECFHLKIQNEKAFAVSDTIIFGELEALCERIDKITIILSMVQNFSSLSKSKIGGIDCFKRMFDNIYQTIGRKMFNVLDMNKTQLDADFEEFMGQMIDLEDQIQDFMSDSIGSVPSAADALQLLHRFQKLDIQSLNSEIPNAKNCILQCYMKMLQSTKEVYDAHKEDSLVVRSMSPVAGRIVWSRQLFRKINYHITYLKNNSDILSSPGGDRAVQLYNSIALVLVEFEAIHHRDWFQGISKELLNAMQATLLVGHPESKEMFVNFDPKFLAILQETKCMMKIGLDVPREAKALLKTEAKLESDHLQLKKLVETFETLRGHIHPVFADILSWNLRKAESTLHKGLTRFTWSSVGLEDFFEEIETNLQAVSQLINKVNGIHKRCINVALKDIAETLLIFLPDDGPITVDNLLAKNEIYTKTVTKHLNQRNEQIHQAVKELISIIGTECEPKPATTISTKSKIRDTRRVAFTDMEKHEEVLEEPAKEEDYDKQCHEMFSYFNGQLVDSLQKCTRLSLDFLKRKLFISSAFGCRDLLTWSDSGGDPEPLVTVQVHLAMDDIVILPPLENIQQAITHVVQSALDVSRGVRRWEHWKAPDDASDQEITFLPNVSGRQKRPHEKTKENIQPKNFYSYVVESLTISELVRLLSTSVTPLRDRAKDALRGFEKYKTLWTENKESNVKDYVAENQSLDDIKERILYYDTLEQEVREMSPALRVGFIELNTGPIKRSICSEAKAWKLLLCSYLNEEYRVKMSEISQFICDYSKILSRPILDLDDVQSVVQALTIIRDKEIWIDRSLGPIEEVYAILTRFQVPITREESEVADTLRYSFAKLISKTVFVQDELSRLLPELKRNLSASVQILQRDMEAFDHEYEKDGPMVPGITYQEASLRLQIFQYRMDDLWRKCVTCSSGEELLGVPVSDYEILHKRRKELGLLQTLYGLYEAVMNSINEYCETLWTDLDFRRIDADLQKFQTKCNQLPKVVKHWQPFLDLMRRISDFRESCTLLEMTTDKAMKKRHWDQIMNLLGCRLDVQSDSFCLSNIMGAAILQYKDEIEEICISAVKEKDVESQLVQVIEMWNKQFLKFSSSKAKGKLLLMEEETAEIIISMEDSLMVLESLLNNRYNGPFRVTIQTWLQKLSASSDILEQWLQVQTLWIYLGAVFVSGDVATQFPQETKRFQNLDKTWTMLMQQAHDKANVIQCCVSDDTLIHLLSHLHEQLQICQRSLTGYLEQKRLIFPRFHFISDNVLLEILGQASDSHFIQPHLAALSDNIDKVEFCSSNYDKILSVISREGEVIQLERPVQAQGAVEIWLGQMLVMQQRSLHGAIRSAYYQMNDEGFQLLHFLNTFPAQVCLLGLQIFWTHDTEEALCSMREDRKVMQNTNQKFLEILNVLIKQTVHNLTKYERIKYETLITVHSHQKDVFDGLVKMRIRSAKDFEWLKQSRFYYKEDLDIVLVSITDMDFVYQNEFLGCAERLVVTQLTDRCYIAMAQAIGMNMAGALIGASATGKMETVKDMGKALGKYVVLFNSSDLMDCRALGRIFKGLAQSGSWGCLEGFHRTDPPVLSVAAQQIYMVFSARKEKRKQFIFSDGDVVDLSPEFGIFLTMHLGGGGGQELPENLKTQFRPISMILPDSQMIIRVKLASYGFLDSASLSQKFYVLYKLCEEQLSSQVHYHFGLRNILSVLRTLGAKKRAKPSESEISMVMRGLRDMNLSQLVDEDVPIFLGLISDLFPGIHLDCRSHTDLQKAVSHQAGVSGLIDHPPWSQKLLQLYEASRVRHSLMTIGPSGSGKSSLIALLMKAMTQCGAPHREVRLNPKAVTAPQMFGSLHPITRDWTDGIFTALWRKQPKTRKGENVWLVLDGPVDATWIENLNSVLDDNKSLTLPNGERLPMARSCRLLCEVTSIENASPATVSRMGIVYLSSSLLSWRVMVKAWLNARPSEERDIFQSLYDQLFEETYTYMNLNLHPTMQLLEYNYIVQSLNLLEGCLPTEHPAAGPLHLHRLFVFALMWSLGALLDVDSRERLEVFLRRHESKLDLPESDAGARQPMFDFLVNEDGDWEHWSKRVPQYSYPSHYIPDYSSILVPHIGSVQTHFLMDIISKQQKAVLLTGEHGIGKTEMIKAYMRRYSAEAHVSKTLIFSAATQPVTFQRAMESYVDKRIGSTYGPSGGKKMTVFIDDINMVPVNVWGDQVTHEVVRQMMEMRGMYSLDKPGEFTSIIDVQFIGAMGHPGGGHDIPQRLKRHFTIFNCTSPSSATIDTIFGVIGCGYFHSCRNFKAEICNLVTKLVPASRALWHLTKVKLLPTPSKSHYIFSLRELSRIWQGMLFISAEECRTVSTLLSLFKHECQRVIADRLVCPEDHIWFEKSLAQVIADHVDPHLVTEVKQDCYFADFLREASESTREEPEDTVPPKIYEKVLSLEFLCEKLKLFQKHLNDTMKGSSTDLVFFRDAMIHLIKISRIIRAPCGNALLVGVGGSGKQSLARLSSFIAGYKIFQIIPTRSYGLSDLLENLKIIYRTAGDKGEGITWIVRDNDIREESFLGYINTILSSGEIPNLFSVDELEEIRQSLLPVMQREFPRQAPTSDNLYEYFLSRCRRNLHLVLCFSPVGDKFRTRCLRFPALVSGCTMDWFSHWPVDALVAVSSYFLSGFHFECSSEVRSQVMEAMSAIHQKMSETCESYYHRFHRRTNVTSESYLSFINNYKTVYTDKRKYIKEESERMNRGFVKLLEANESIRTLCKELEEKEHVLTLASVEADRALAQLTATAQDVAKVQNQVQLLEDKGQKVSEEIQIKKSIAEHKLEAARPALQEAEAALNAMKSADISAIRKLAKPPHLTMRIMDSCLLLLQKRLDPVVVDPEKPCCKPSWGESLKLLNCPGFLQSLRQYQKDTVNQEMVELLQPYFQMEDYTVENAKKLSGNMAGLLLWTRAMAAFYHVNQEVLPLKACLMKHKHRLDLTNLEMTKLQQQLEEKRSELVTAQSIYDGRALEKMNLLNEAEMGKRGIEAASSLLDGLNGEKQRWTEQIQVFRSQLVSLEGDVLMASAFLTYCGPFNQTFRDLLLKDVWEMEIKSRNIRMSEDLSVVSMLADQTMISEWILHGLPGDEFSILNGLIITTAARYPLLIDPQNQGKMWIKKKEQRNDLQVTSLHHTSFLAQLEECLTLGRPLLIEDIGEDLHPCLDNVLDKTFLKSGAPLKVRVEDKEVEVKDSFRLYMTSRLPNPVFPPEINAKTSVIDFTATMKGLEKQLLSRVVLTDQEDLESERIKLMQEINVNQCKMKDLQDGLLHRLSSAPGSLVEDKSLMEVLRVMKQTMSEVHEKLLAAADTEERMRQVCEEYRPVATRGSLLYALSTDMSTFSPMYHTSLSHFLQLFDRSIHRSERSTLLPRRVRHILDYMTYEVFTYYSMGLYERHRFLFTLLLALKVDLQRGDINLQQYRALIWGGAALDLNDCPPKPYKWILDMTWLNLVALSKLSQFSEIMTQVKRNEKGWKTWCDCDAPEEETIPDGYSHSLDAFHRLLLIRSCCPHRTLSQARKYIEGSLNEKYLEPVILNLASAWEESGPRTPLLCLLSAGSDPTPQIEALAKRMRLECRMVSLGPGQDVQARRLLHSSMQQGGWVLLQNCHLGLDFMEELPEAIKTSAAVHETFRVWMTTAEHRHFPIAVLQTSIKFSNESPQGMRAGLKRTLTGISQDLLDASDNPMWKPLLYTLTFLHSAVQERRRYVPLGWNIPYDFSSVDFMVSVQFLQNHLDESGVRKGVSWNMVRYMMTEVQYGGRITEVYDKRLLSCISKLWLSEKIFHPDFCFYCGYKIPQCRTVEQCVDSTQSLPLVDSPQVFGLHPNADITYQSIAATVLLEAIASIQPRDGRAPQGEPREAVVYGIVEDMAEKLPPDYIPHEVQARLRDTGAQSPMNMFLHQEIDRMQKVISIVRSSLSDLRRAIGGSLVMSESLGEASDALYEAGVPALWRKVSWASASLGLWFRALLERNRQLTAWIYEGRPSVFWMTGFFHPQAFLGAMRQEASRENRGWRLDSVYMRNEVLKHMKEDVTAPPTDGVYIHGLFLEGGGWDRRNSKLVEPSPKVQFSVLPVVHIYAVNFPSVADDGIYICPVYRRPERSDLTCVTTVSLRSVRPPDHWTLRGVAALCSTR